MGVVEHLVANLRLALLFLQMADSRPLKGLACRVVYPLSRLLTKLDATMMEALRIAAHLACNVQSLQHLIGTGARAAANRCSFAMRRQTCCQASVGLGELMHEAAQPPRVISCRHCFGACLSHSGKPLCTAPEGVPTTH